jgi:recombination protein RecR
MKVPKAVQNLIESFERLPGVGPKTAQRLTFYLLHVPQHELDTFSQSLVSLKRDTVVCSVCFSVGEANPCDICTDSQRDGSVICVVEQPLDVLALERSRKYTGLYHVLHGKIDPLNNIGPDEIFINQLFSRLRPNSKNSLVEEIILATNPTMEGEGTAMYIAKRLKVQNPDVRVTRIGRGLPIGADLEYADPTTLDRAMEGRQSY